MSRSARPFVATPTPKETEHAGHRHRQDTASTPRKLATVARAWLASAPDEREKRALARMQLDAPASFQEKLLAKLVLHALRGRPSGA